MFSVERLLEYGPLGLFLVAFFESTVFPIPPDVLLFPLCLMNPRLSWWYAFLATAASILGAFLGYAAGRKAGRPVVERFFAREVVEKVEALFRKYGGWAVGIAAFTPVPYKVFTLGAGLFRVPFFTFTVASVIGRAGRFFLEGGMVYFLGERARSYLGRDFEIATLALTAVLLVGVAVFPKIGAYLRKYRIFDRPVYRRLARIASGTKASLSSLRALGIRFLAGVSASLVLLLLVVSFLWDLAGPERAALNRSLTPVYERMSEILGVRSGPGFWSIWRVPWIWASLALAGIVRWISWESRRRSGYMFDAWSTEAGESGATRPLVPRSEPSLLSGNVLRMVLLVVGSFTCEIVVGGFVSRAYGTRPLFSGGEAFLAPYFLVFGTYLLSKGIPKAVQIPLLVAASFLAAGNLVHVVSASTLDAAAATASLLVSFLMSAVSYTVLVYRRDGG